MNAPHSDAYSYLLSLDCEPMREFLQAFGVAAIVHELGADGVVRFIAANGQACRMLRFEHYGNAGKPISTFLPEVIVAEIEHGVRECLERRTQLVIETKTRIIEPSRWIRINRTPILGGKDGAGRVIDTITDIHEQKLTEAALRESERSLRRAQELGRIGHWFYNLKTGRVTVSEVFWRVLGVSHLPTDMSVDEVLALLGPDEARRLQGYARQAQEAGVGYNFEARVPRRNGDYLDIYFEAEPEFDRGGKLVGFFGVVQDITERKQTERALAASEHKLKRAMAIGKMGHWYLKLDGMEFEASEELLALHKLPAGTVLDWATVQNSFPRATREAFDNALQRALESRTGFVEEGKVMAPDNLLQTVKVFGEPDFDPEGRVVGYFGVTLDISEIKRTEQTLKDAMRLGRMGHWHYDLRTGRVEVSQEWLASIGSAMAAVTHINQVDAMLPAEERQHIQALRRSAAERGTGYTYEASNILDGKVKVVRVEAEPEFDTNNQVVGFFGITQDLTEHRKIERELISSQRRNNAIVETLDRAGIGVGIISDEGRVLFINQTMLHIAGISPDATVVGLGLRDLAHFHENLAYLADSLGHVAEGQGVDVDNMVWQRPDGQKLHTLLRAVPLEDVGALIVMVDRTDLFRMEALKDQVERNLQHTQKMEALGRLAAGVAHEINNLLQPILTFARHAQGDIPAEKRNHYLGRIGDAALRMREIVANMLAFARPKVDRPTVQPIEPLIRRAIEIVDQALPPDVSVRLELAAPEAEVRLNETEFAQVMLNLVLNASDAMNRSGEVVIRACPDDAAGRITIPQIAPGRYVRIDVEDTGGGMEPDVQKHAFEPFFSTKPQSEAAGLGLAVVYGIVTRWGGGIAVRTAPGAGTCVSVFVLLSDPPADGPEG